jgi:serine phosphatase RsbU (regulator of sigma subunit)
MADDIARSRDVLVRNERLEREVEIASQIQLALAPEKIVAAGISASGATRPTESVGGDYFDVIATPDASWIAVGDVAGHGLNAGLVTLMVQCGISSAVRQPGVRSPREVLTQVNRVLYENIRQRLRNDEHVTLSLLRHERGGRITFAGAHEDIIVWRARTGRCECIATTGTWLGMMEEIGDVTEDEIIQLDPGDLLVLYTDGLTEARDAQGALFGVDRLCRAIEAVATVPVEHVRDRILDQVKEWRAVQDDDETILVIRQSAGNSEE